jgi:hypothetical protein
MQLHGKQFDLGSVAYLAGDTAGQRMTKLNNAANAALGTTGTPFVAGGTTTVVFTGAAPAASGSQAGTAMLAQADQASQGVLSLLR